MPGYCLLQWRAKEEGVNHKHLHHTHNHTHTHICTYTYTYVHMQPKYWHIQAHANMFLRKNKQMSKLLLTITHTRMSYHTHGLRICTVLQVYMSCMQPAADSSTQHQATYFNLKENFVFLHIKPYNKDIFDHI